MIDPLISAEDAIRLHQTGEAIFLDASWTFDGGPSFKVDGVIPGAVAFDIDAIKDTASPLPHMLPSPAAFEKFVGGLGISSTDSLIVYDRIGLFSAPRVWWMFKTMGHDTIRVLDGGLPAWIRVGGEVTQALSKPTKTGQFISHYRPEWVVSRHDVETALSDPDARILDARPYQRFTGEAKEPREGMRSGHMPGATCVPWTSLVTDTGQLNQDIDLPYEGRLIATCGSGVTASLLALALYRQGKHAAVYDGSWAEWGRSSDTPVVTCDQRKGGA